MKRISAAEVSEFLFAEASEGKAVEVLRTGEFVDRNGKTVKVADEDLDTFVASFEEGTAGQEVPIDVNHERAEAAGWVRKVWRDGDRLLASVDWNDVGRKLVGDKVYRYLSATIDLAKKVIKSISLVNFPAVKGLQPVELGESGVYALEETKPVALGDFLQSRIHKIFTTIADDLAGAGHVTVEERIALSGAIGAALKAFADTVGEVGTKVIPVSVSGPEIWFAEEAELVIRKEGSEIILYSSDESKVLGRFPFGSGKEYGSEEAAREAAAKREKQVQYFKREGGAMTKDWAELQGNIQAIIGAWGKWAGSFTKCEQVLAGKPGITDEKALCAWLHKQGEGKWPAEGQEYYPNVLELQAIADAVAPMIAKLEEEEQMNEKELAEMREKIRKEYEVELAAQQKQMAEMREKVRAEVEAELKQKFARRATLVEFVGQVTGGEHGLSSKPEDIIALLEALPGDQERQAMMAMLKAKVVDFGEHGSGREGSGGKKALPKEYADALDAFEMKLLDLRDPVLNLGDLSEYDLSKWQGGGK